MKYYHIYGIDQLKVVTRLSLMNQWQENNINSFAFSNINHTHVRWSSWFSSSVS